MLLVLLVLSLEFRLLPLEHFVHDSISLAHVAPFLRLLVGEWVALGALALAVVLPVWILCGFLMVLGWSCVGILLIGMLGSIAVSVSVGLADHVILFLGGVAA